MLLDIWMYLWVCGTAADCVLLLNIACDNQYVCDHTCYCPSCLHGFRLLHIVCAHSRAAKISWINHFDDQQKFICSNFHNGLIILSNCCCFFPLQFQRGISACFLCPLRMLIQNKTFEDVALGKVTVIYILLFKIENIINKLINNDNNCCSPKNVTNRAATNSYFYDLLMYQLSSQLFVYLLYKLCKNVHYTFPKHKMTSSVYLLTYLHPYQKVSKSQFLTYFQLPQCW